MKIEKLKLKNDEYEKLDQGYIGKGSYGVVWKMRRVSDGKMVAVKTLQYKEYKSGNPYHSSFMEKVRDALIKEINFLKLIKDPFKKNILPILDYGEYDGNPVMVMPLADQSLFDIHQARMQKRVFLYEPDDLLTWIEQIANGLKEVHTLKSFDGVKKYVYRDLKSSNILLMNGNAFLCDFGSVKHLEHELTGSLVISIAWAAPEMLIPYKIINKGKPKFNYNSSADIYSFGLLLYSLITGDTLSSQGQLTEIVGTNPQKPRDNKITRYYEKKGGINQNEIDELKRQILNLFFGNQTLISFPANSLPDPQYITERIVDLISSMLEVVSSRRPDSLQIIKKIKTIKEFYKPELNKLEIKAQESIKTNTEFYVKISAKGKGLLQDGSWLYVYIGNEDFKALKIERISNNLWKACFDSIKSSGKYQITVCAKINNQIISTNCCITVKSTPEELWKNGDYVNALLEISNRKKWLKKIKKQSKKNDKYKMKWLTVLENVRSRKGDLADVNFLYWDLMQDEQDEQDIRFFNYSFVKDWIKKFISFRIYKRILAFTAFLITIVVFNYYIIEQINKLEDNQSNSSYENKEKINKLEKNQSNNSYENKEKINKLEKNQSNSSYENKEKINKLENNHSNSSYENKEKINKLENNHSISLYEKVNNHENESSFNSNKRIVDEITGMTFVFIKGSCYSMGCGNWAGSCDEDEKPPHKVCVDDFYMGIYEVTVDQFMKFIKDSYKGNGEDYVWKCNGLAKPEGFNQTGKHPVTCVTWEDAKAFADWLSKKNKKYNFRLPIEAEWEYGCRGGGKEIKYPWSDQLNEDPICKEGELNGANKCSNGTIEVGSYKSNALGLFDMSGNVWEWCEDFYDDGFYNTKQALGENPINTKKSWSRVLRGGSWGGLAWDLRCSDRTGGGPRVRGANLGFRLVLFFPSISEN